jgi:hypothetical protein
MTVTAVHCDEVAARLPAIMSGAAPADAEIVSHVETCLRCHAELARYRKLLRMLGQLRSQAVDPPPGLLADVLEALDAAARRRVVRSLLTGRRIAYGSGVAAAVTAATLVLLLRERTSRLARRTHPEQGAIV